MGVADWHGADEGCRMLAKPTARKTPGRARNRLMIATPPEGSLEKAHALIAALEKVARERVRDANKKCLGRAAIEAIQADLDRNKAIVSTMMIDYESAVPVTIDTIRSPLHEGRLVKVRVAIPSMTIPIQYTVSEMNADIVDMIGRDADDACANRVRGLAASFAMENGISTEVCFDRRLIETFQKTKEFVAYQEVLLFVTTIPAPSIADDLDENQAISFAKYVFFMVDIRPLESALQILAPTPGDIELSTVMFSRDSHVIDTARNIVMKAIDVQNAGSLSVLVESIDFQILSAATEGRRASSIVLGPPSVGKSLIAKAAKLLHPIAREVVPTKITEAGLTGFGTVQAKTRKPGFIPQAHQGVLIAQDFNQANSVKNQRFISAVTTPMQDGYAIDSSVSMTTYKAAIAVHIDCNRRSDVRRKKTDSSGLDRLVEDTGIPMNIWSRVSYAVEIPRDIHAMIETTKSIMLEKEKRSDKERIGSSRQVKLLQSYIAIVRDRFKVVSIPEQVRAYLTEMVMEAMNVTRSRMQRHPDIADFMTRLGEQAISLTEAHARLHYRGTATADDVDGIMRFIWRKLDFIRDVIFGGQLDSADASAAEKGRRRMIRMVVAQSRATTGTVADVRRLTGITTATPATIEADLRCLYGDPDADGRFNFGTVRV